MVLVAKYVHGDTLATRLLGKYVHSDPLETMMQRGKKAAILLANDQSVVRQGIRQLLEQEADFEVVGEAGNSLDAVKLAGELKPDVVIMEARMPKMSGVEAIKRIKAVHPKTAILILTMEDDEQYIGELLRVGAAGYILKTAHIADLVQAIRSVCAGEFISDPALMQRLLKRAARGQPMAVDFGEHLTRRETEVLNLAAKGMSNRDIASYLGLAEGTVKGYLVNIFGKMGVGSRIEAVLEAIRRGWISPEDESSPGRK